MKQSDRWLMAELSLFVPTLTLEGRDAVISWLRDTADKIEKKSCGAYSFEQPDRKYKLKVGK